MAIVVAFGPLLGRHLKKALALANDYASPSHRDAIIRSILQLRAYAVWRRDDVIAIMALPDLDSMAANKVLLYPALIHPDFQKMGLICLLNPLTVCHTVMMRETGHKWKSLEVDLQNYPDERSIFPRFGFVDQGAGKFAIDISKIHECAKAALPLCGFQVGQCTGSAGELKIVLHRAGPILRHGCRPAIEWLAENGGPLDDAVIAERTSTLDGFMRSEPCEA